MLIKKSFFVRDQIKNTFTKTYYDNHHGHFKCFLATFTHKTHYITVTVPFPVNVPHACSVKGNNIVKHYYK